MLNLFQGRSLCEPVHGNPLKPGALGLGLVSGGVLIKNLVVLVVSVVS